MSGFLAVKVLLLLLCTLGGYLPPTLSRRGVLPRLQLRFQDLVQSKRMVFLPINASDLHSVILDEDRRRIYVAMDDNLLSANLDKITTQVKKLHWPATHEHIEECKMAGKDPKMDCANFLRVLHIFNQTHLYVCGTGAFHPSCAFIHTSVFYKEEPLVLQQEQTECGKGKCPYDPHQQVASALIDGELYAGISSDFMSRDTGFFRALGHRNVIRTEQYNSRWLQDPQFVKVAALADGENGDDDKVYLFFTERAQEAEASGGKVLYSRVARVCKNDIGGQRSLVNKWSTFLKARLVCSITGPDAIETHFDVLKDIFILNEKDGKKPLIYGVFSTSSNILNGSAVCVYKMEDIAATFRGSYAHKEGPEYKWLPYMGRVPVPRPGMCPSASDGNYRSTRDYPDDVIFFSRIHPLMYSAVYPINQQPLLVRVGMDYKFTRIVIDRVEAVDGQYDVLFIGTDKGVVLKTTLSTKANQEPEEVFLEELEVFQEKSPITSLSLSRQKPWLYVASKSGVIQLALHQCEVYGKGCAECCLARDPYCTWDGASCSPYSPSTRRRNVRDLIGDPLMQCFKEGALLQVKAEEKEILVAEGNGTYLECLPKAHHASVTWLRVINESSWELQKVTAGNQILLLDQGLVIRQVQQHHAGTYYCQTEEHGYQWTLLKLQLVVIVGEQIQNPKHEKVQSHLNDPVPLSSSSRHPWYKDIMNLIYYPSKMNYYCEQVWQRSQKKKSHSHPRAGVHKVGADADNTSVTMGIKRGKHKLHAKALRLPRST
ncbi:semaphorin-3A-like [Rhinatrema bivittatum]|uniref:semaphorin-3A-like n=1 Tax=Rhinatrema bivittatum TaxID=194408 RepID=UPI001128A07E|nr:semaphorin-3A-like [Rhinatrema bivittatum]